MSFDPRRAERALKPLARGALKARAAAELRWVDSEGKAGVPLLIDTTVYLDALQGRTPTAVDDLLRYRSIFHSAVCVAELTRAFGRLDPAHSATKKALAALAGAIDEIPRHRLFAPDTDLWGKAGMLAGKHCAWAASRAARVRSASCSTTASSSCRPARLARQCSRATFAASVCWSSWCRAGR